MSDTKLKVISLFPIRTSAGRIIRLDTASGRWTFSLDYNKTPNASPQPILDESGNPITDEHGDPILDSGFTVPSSYPSASQYLAIFDGTNYFLANPSSLVAHIITTPSPLVAFDNATVGAVVGTLSVVPGSGSYSFWLTSNPGGKYQIVGNQLQVAAPLTAGTDTITIAANNGIGPTHTLTTTVTVIHRVTGYVPTYHIYGF